MIDNKKFSVLFVCTGNSARSVLGEGLLNHLGVGRFKGYSAGSHPVGKVNPFALQVLSKKGITADFSSKSWDVFSTKDSPKIDLAITVCAHAENEVCPAFSTSSVTVHWGLEDPAAVEGSDDDKCAAFEETATLLQTRIMKLIEYPLTKMSTEEIQKACAHIHNMYSVS